MDGSWALASDFLLEVYFPRPLIGVDAAIEHSWPETPSVAERDGLIRLGILYPGMTELPERAARAFRRHDAFEPEDATDGERFIAVSTPFDAVVDATPGEGGQIAFTITVRVPMLDEVTEDKVAPIVEEGWYETLDRRVQSIGGGVLTGDHDLTPAVTETTFAGDRVAEVRASFADIDPGRGVDDAAAVVDFVEGTFVQGVIPGYDYTEPVTGILTAARRAGGSDDVQQ